MVEVFPLDAEKKLGERAVDEQDHPDDAQDDLHSDAFVPFHLCAGSPNLHTVYIVPSRQEGKTEGFRPVSRGGSSALRTRGGGCCPSREISYTMGHPWRGFHASTETENLTIILLPKPPDADCDLCNPCNLHEQPHLLGGSCFSPGDPLLERRTCDCRRNHRIHRVCRFRSLSALCAQSSGRIDQDNVARVHFADLLELQKNQKAQLRPFGQGAWQEIEPYITENTSSG